jgi:leader peptidase (prepilin peptidase)/N-methyltransferase
METYAWFNDEFPWLVALFFFGFGAIVGSFLNVCIYRIPEGRSIVHPGSHCRCGKPVQPRDNLPIVSWLWLRGKARCCGAKISARYPFVEALTGGLFVACWQLLPPSLALVGMAFASLVVVVTFIDLDHMIIPDVCSVGGTVVAWVLAFAVPLIHGFSGDPWFVDGIRSLIVAVLGSFIGAALILWIKVLAEAILNREAMGEGDIVWMGVVGALCGWQGAFFAVFGGAVLGVLAVIVLLPFRARKATQAGADDAEEGSASPEIPFGPMLAVGGLIDFVVLGPYVDAWFAEVASVFFG